MIWSICPLTYMYICIYTHTLSSSYMYMLGILSVLIVPIYSMTMLWAQDNRTLSSERRQSYLRCRFRKALILFVYLRSLLLMTIVRKSSVRVIFIRHMYNNVVINKSWQPERAFPPNSDVENLRKWAYRGAGSIGMIQRGRERERERETDMLEVYQDIISAGRSG